MSLGFPVQFLKSCTVVFGNVGQNFLLASINLVLFELLSHVDFVEETVEVLEVRVGGSFVVYSTEFALAATSQTNSSQH